MSLRVQLLLLQVAIVLVLVCTTGVVASTIQEHQLREAYLDRMTGVAQSVAGLPAVVEAFDDADPAATIQPIAELIRRASDVTYVVVAGPDGTRYSHPDPDRIGERVSTDPSPALAGQVWTGTQTGTLGESWRVKVPVYGPTADDASPAAVVGVASVGILESELRRDWMSGLAQLFLALAGATVVGVLCAAWVAHLVRQRFFRLEPAQVRALMHDLDGARGLTAALRAQSHEFANKLHVISGLLELGRTDDAVRFIERAAHAEPGAAPPVPEAVRAPEVVALLRVKARIAAEHDIGFEVDAGSRVAPPGPQGAARHEDLLTVLGNLVDNAAEAVGPGGHVHLLVDDGGEPARTDGRAGTLRVVVDDDGPGIPRASRRAVLEDGFSTKQPTPERGSRGVGLALVRRAAERHGGGVRVSTSPLGGARVAVTLPGAALAAPTAPVVVPAAPGAAQPVRTGGGHP
ncbi:sensor histidine kinase [Xylanimonas oleitrophica]|nr:ATP-binding protein [Xylanimonas oleitrophica]